MTGRITATVRQRVRGVALAGLVGVPLLVLAGGGGGAAASTAAAKPTKTAVAATCQRVADVLSDGPDPGVDPVGYALAQVRPLREIRTRDAKLHKAIDDLAAAYETVYKTNDKKGTEAAVKKAGKKVDAICPGAF